MFFDGEYISSRKAGDVASRQRSVEYTFQVVRQADGDGLVGEPASSRGC